MAPISCVRLLSSHYTLGAQTKRGRGMTRTSRQECLDEQVAMALPLPYVTNRSPWRIFPPASPARPDA